MPENASVMTILQSDQNNSASFSLVRWSPSFPRSAATQYRRQTNPHQQAGCQRGQHVAGTGQRMRKICSLAQRLLFCGNGEHLDVFSEHITRLPCALQFLRSTYSANIFLSFLVSFCFSFFSGFSGASVLRLFRALFLSVVGRACRTERRLSFPQGLGELLLPQPRCRR